MRHKPVEAVVVAQIHDITAEVQVVRATTIAGKSTRRPIATAGTEVVNLANAVIAQRREEEVFINHTISRLAVRGSKVVVVGRSTHILTPGIYLL